MGDDYEALNKNANTWQGTFPVKNESVDGFMYVSPVKSYSPNSIGLYDVLGNVWELTSDLFNFDYYKEIDTSKPQINPRGSNKSFVQIIYTKKNTLLKDLKALKINT